MFDGTPWPALDRLRTRAEARVVAQILGEPFPLAVAPLPRVPDPSTLTPQGIQALRAAAADALDIVLEAVVRDRNNCSAVAVAEALFEALRIAPSDGWPAWREAHTACMAMPRAERRRLWLDPSGRTAQGKAPGSTT